MKTDKQIMKEAIGLFKEKAIHSLEKRDPVGALIFAGVSYLLNQNIDLLEDVSQQVQPTQKRDVIDVDQLDPNNRK